MKRKENARYPLPVLKDSRVETVGPTISDALVTATAQRLTVAFIKAFTQVQGAPPTKALTLDMHKHNRAIVAHLLARLDNPIRDGFHRAETKYKQGARDDTITPQKVRAIRETFVTEADRLMKAGKKVTKKALYNVIEKRHKVGTTSARKLTRDVPCPPPPLRDDKAPQDDSTRFAA
ncbi:hypothetical protein F0160_21040 [Paraburkholderia sp. JPY303]|uniref:hypothetical protein n=1 Tax=Paraburkholderia atlantica TaxID=2654982 RepID=UPI001591070E|nr:hypothetical protein [Paraburkholderia atlantica]NUY32975.1 hypothetical protein [Paraburkholderia atlantica]